MTFEWIKNWVANEVQTNYSDLSLYVGTKRIPEPFCLVDMNITSETIIYVKLEEGALIG